MSLSDRLNAPDAEGWKPAVDDEIEGDIVEISFRDGGWGPYPIVTLQLDDGTFIAIHAFHFVLKDRLVNELQIAQGDRLAVKYLGAKTPKDGGKPYENYKAVSEQRGPRPATSTPSPASAPSTPSTPAPAAEPAEDPF